MQKTDNNIKGGSVVADVKMPKIKTSPELAAKINAFAIGFAIFFGIVGIFGSIAAFTANAKTSWSFGVPLVGVLNNTTGVPVLVATTFLALAFAIVGLLSIKKLKDATALKCAYAKVAGVFAIFAFIATTLLVAIGVYSLLALGEKSGVSQGGLWLNGFLPTLILAGASILVAILAKKVAGGDINLVRIMSIVAISAASLAFILVIISTLISFYGGKTGITPNTMPDYDYSSLFKGLLK